MAKHRNRISRRRLLTTAAVITLGAAALSPVTAQASQAAPAPSASASAASTGRAAPVYGDQSPVRALEQAAHPLRSTDPGRNTTDLRALSSMIGNAKVVGLGEATHGSHEFFTLKERLFRHLVEEKGFTTFALELSWSAGLEIDEYLQTGKGDARRIAKRALANSPWDREEFVSLITWMRDYNRRHPHRTVHFMGDDLGAPSINDAFFARVTGYVQRTHPESLPRLNELYAGLRPIDDVFAYFRKPMAERQRLADRAQQALELITNRKDSGAGTESGAGAGARAGTSSGGDAYAWAVQNAQFIAQTTKFLTMDINDPASVTAAQRFRDEVMARNVTWWQRRTGHKILLSAQNDHVGYAAGDPELYPKTQGSFLRDLMGGNYLPIGFTFYQGSFLSKDAALAGDWKEFTVGTPKPTTNEYVLDKVRHRNFYLDVRHAPLAARTWLNTTRPTRNIGTEFPHPDARVAIARSFDVLIHLHEVTAATKTKP
ncbi:MULTISPECIES: erythromycin esterase family protein [Streptomyces]|uniref:Erythromycin esterase family protein n=3 Tax=Streptomyces rimosus TaxID=1927 RepID=A0A8A1UVW9_STRR1|nr:MULTISPECIES: erythromycin esterase family protein [Streptomyces]KOG75253.1 erythromycin esterase [Kitasatospora aureofaciens]MYT45851.1 erythromycin esterase family protein [Streptomyces sp. SID5471]QGY65985.1 erythromycin esterase family protein [Streptomyces rimosus R6-500]KEF05360.1 erythromycin esterase [Streptomyces rimosus]KOT32986.1 erythromycin esterase [Streptomyces rimosus subsp. rimosus]